MKNTTGKLSVEVRGNGQFSVSGNNKHDDWDRDYFQVGGYFGSYGPDLFAAAPDLYNALGELVSRMTDIERELNQRALDALARARGEMT